MLEDKDGAGDRSASCRPREEKQKSGSIQGLIFHPTRRSLLSLSLFFFFPACFVCNATRAARDELICSCWAAAGECCSAGAKTRPDEGCKTEDGKSKTEMLDRLMRTAGLLTTVNPPVSTRLRTTETPALHSPLSEARNPTRARRESKNR